MNDRHGTERRSRVRWLVLTSLLGLVLVSPISVIAAQPPVTASTVGDHDRPTPRPALTATSSMAVTVGGPAVVHRDRSVYVWSREPLDVTVELGAAVTGTKLCLYRTVGTEVVERTRCRELDGASAERRLTFERIGTPSAGPTSYRFEARLFDRSNHTVSSANSTRVVELLNWSAVDNETLGDYAADRGLVPDDNGTTNPSETTTADGADSDREPDKRSNRTDRSTQVAGQNSTISDSQRTDPTLTEVVGNVVGTGLDNQLDLPGPPVLVLSGGGLLALLALLYVRRGWTDDEESEPEFVDTGQPQTDADRVVRLLQENGGQLKQSEIVEETGWSKAKVSRLLTRMDDHSRIRKRQDGRQNVIILRQRE